MVPKTIGRYHVIRKIGAGGMGEVYLAEDTALKRRVAIKFVIPSEVGDKMSRERLVREAQAAATLDHRNVCAIYEVGEHDGQPFFAMQYVEGDTLAERLGSGALPIADVIRIGTEMADALSDAHAHGIVHRDIKPQNIMLTSRGDVKVLDFGLATRALASGTATTIASTSAGVVAGTTAYMSPEQLRGEPLDPSTDVFSFGCVLHEMVNGKPPFARASASETIAAVLGGDAPAVDPSTPAELQRIIRKCLEKDRTRRYSSAADLLVDLRNLARDTAAPRAEGIRTSARNTRSRMVAIAVIAVALLAAGAGWILSRRSSITPARVRVVAILPLATAEPSSAYLGDGISESVINSLSRLSQLKVLARTTTFRYRGANIDPAALRRDLGVDVLLTGTVLQHGESLVVQAELIDTADNRQLWGQRYSNRRLADVFEVQEEIARAIATSLRLELGTGAPGFSKRYTDDVEAYRAYIVGREYAQRRTVADLRAAVEHYQRAIGRDQGYALAWTGLTDAYLNLCARVALPYSEGRRLALEAAERARSLDPDLAEAHAAIGQTYVFAGPFDFEAGDRALLRAIELNPGSPLAHQYLAVSLLEQGRIPQGLREIELAHELDPLSAFMTRFLAFGQLLQGDPARAMTTYRTAAASGSPFATTWEAELFNEAGATSEGLRSIASLGTGREDDPYVRLNLATLNSAGGRRDEALAVAKEFERQSSAEPAWARFAARVYAALGEDDRSLEMLARSIDGGAVPIFYKDEPLWNRMRQNPRFVALLRRMRIPL